MITIVVPLVPPSPNAIKRSFRNPHVYRKLRKTWEDEIFYGDVTIAERRKLLLAAEKGKMRVHITVHHAKQYDADNLQGAQKLVLDALVNIHFLTDDSAEYLELVPAEQVQSREKKTVIEIGPVD